MTIPLDLSFDAMSALQRAAVLNWANSHDWGASPAKWWQLRNRALGRIEMTLAVSSIAFDAEGERFTETLHATTLREVRDWAGY